MINIGEFVSEFVDSFALSIFLMEQYQRRIKTIEGHITNSSDDWNRIICEEQTSGEAGIGVSWIYISSAIKAMWNLWLLDSLPGYSFSSLFEECVKNYPEKTAIIFEGKEYTYKQIDLQSNLIANWAHEILQIKCNEVVALMMENRPEFIWTWLGLAKLGVVTAFINYKLHGSSLTHVLKISEAKAFIIGSELAEAFSKVYSPQNALVYQGTHGKPISSLEESIRNIFPNILDEQLNKISSKETPPVEWRKEKTINDPLWFIYTSGTTGLPKAAKVTQRNVFMRTIILKNMLNVSSDERIYCSLPLYHSSGSVISLTAWHCGGTIILRRNFSANEFWNDCKKYGATMFIYIGELCRYILATAERSDDKNHKVRLAVGNGLRPDIWEKFQNRFGIKQIVEFYASTEGSSLINMSNKVGAVGYFPWFLQFRNPAKLIRYDVETDTHVKDEKGFCILCKPNEVGELICKIELEAVGNSVTSGGTFSGYTDKKATEKKIMKDVFEKGDAWFRTGDLLKSDSQGFYYFVDRIGDTYRWKGENVSTNEVAEVISVFPGISESTVFGVAVPGYEGRCGMASVVLSKEIDWKEFYNHLHKNLPSYAHPVFIRIQSAIPKTSTFKYQKVVLAQEGFNVHHIRDGIYFRDHNLKTYVKLEPSVHDNILNGTVKI